MLNNGQQIFDFGVLDNDPSSFIVSNCNIDAYNLAHNFSHPGIAIILGEERSGKSELLNIWIRNNKAIKLNHDEIYNLDKIDIEAIVAVDDFDLITDEEALFYFLNYCLLNKVKLLMTASCLPKYKRDDINSRIAAAIYAVIRAPDEELMKMLFKRYFSIEQTIVSDETVEFLVRRIDSKFSALWNVCESLNIESFKAMRPINRNIVTSVLNK